MDIENLQEAVDFVARQDSKEKRQVAMALVTGSVKTTGTGRKAPKSVNVQTLLRKGIPVKCSLKDDNTIVFEGEGLQAKSEYSVEGFKVAAQALRDGLFEGKGDFKYLPNSLKSEIGEGWSNKQTELCMTTPEVAQVLQE